MPALIKEITFTYQQLVEAARDLKKILEDNRYSLSQCEVGFRTLIHVVYHTHDERRNDILDEVFGEYEQAIAKRMCIQYDVITRKPPHASKRIQVYVQRRKKPSARPRLPRAFQRTNQT